MHIKRITQATLLAISVSLTAVAAAQSAVQPKSKVVFQISDSDVGKWNVVLANAKNVQQEIGAEKVQIAIVAFGPGIGMLKADSSASNRVTEVASSGIEIVACERAMAGQKLTKADMNTAVSYVPLGVVELMKRQSAGWAYIHP